MLSCALSAYHNYHRMGTDCMSFFQVLQLSSPQGRICSATVCSVSSQAQSQSVIQEMISSWSHHRVTCQSLKLSIAVSFARVMSWVTADYTNQLDRVCLSCLGRQLVVGPQVRKYFSGCMGCVRVAVTEPDHPVSECAHSEFKSAGC